MQVSYVFTVKFIFCSSKANLWRLKSISLNRNEPKQYLHVNTWQITEVSNFTRWHANNSGNHADLWNLAHHDVNGSTLLKILPIPQNEVPFMNTSETEKVEWPNTERQRGKEYVLSWVFRATVVQTCHNFRISGDTINLSVSKEHGCQCHYMQWNKDIFPHQKTNLWLFVNLREISPF